MKTLFIVLAMLVAAHSYARLDTLNVPNINGGECVSLEIDLYDSYGDGWNGAILSIYDFNYNEVAYTTMFNGYYVFYSICLNPGCYYIYVSDGTYPWEISWYAYSYGAYLTQGTTGPSPWFTLGVPTSGCTNIAACNYNPSATCDDGSCCYDYCFTLNMFDSFGDGWDGAYIQITGTNGTYIGSYGPIASYDYIQGCLPAGCYEVQVYSGNFDSEVSWNLNTTTYYGEFPVMVASGGAPYIGTFGVGGCCHPGCAVPQACNYDSFAPYQSGLCCYENCATFYMYDYANDGWQGAVATITNWENDVVFSDYLHSGDFASNDLCLPDGCYTITLSADIFPGEVGWVYFDGYNYLQGTAGEEQYFQVGDIVSGCTDPLAVNYNALANCNSGCAYSCTADLDGNGVVNVADLLLFSSQFGSVCLYVP